MINTIRDIWQKRTIVGHFVSAQLTTSYRPKSFGFVWALLGLAVLWTDRKASTRLPAQDAFTGPRMDNDRDRYGCG